MYSKIPILRPPFGLLKSGLKYHFGLGKTGLNSEAVLILGGLNSDILLYIQSNFSGSNTFGTMKISS